METFGKFMFALLFAFIGIIISGFIFMKIWGWFIVPVFDIQTLTFVQSIGILVFKSMLFGKYEPENKTFEETLIESLGKLTYLLLSFGISWIVYILIF